MKFSSEAFSRGIYHIHSDYSYDGTNPLAEIAEWAKARGLGFVLLTEHDLGFDQEKFERYCAECAENSGDVLLLPGMEYEVIHDGAIIHVGAVGVPVFLDSSVIEQGLMALVDAIHRQGGLAVLHHPNNIKEVLTQKHIEAFDFIERWNTKFDCGFGPNFQFLRWLDDMNSQGPYLVSADIHDVGRFNETNLAVITTDVSPEALSLSTIVACLRQQRYRCQKGNWTFSPGGACQVPNALYRILPAVCLIKKKLFRFARFFVPEKYQRAVYQLVNRSWIR
jgi:hypothetical protein